ncbi:hypothetical protein KQX54_011479 [Cotesia glomerata]|uniref:Uncharacterized protein n=1 Tax=Cotesia glomerata TaxID=32391 RepID=A0AAV7IHL7_COTGL|nr:hypothetical protein KQX54_011479 [Cotesia glomerata]
MGCNFWANQFHKSIGKIGEPSLSLLPIISPSWSPTDSKRILDREHAHAVLSEEPLHPLEPREFPEQLGLFLFYCQPDSTVVLYCCTRGSSLIDFFDKFIVCDNGQDSMISSLRTFSVSSPISANSVSVIRLLMCTLGMKSLISNTVSAASLSSSSSASSDTFLSYSCSICCFKAGFSLSKKVRSDLPMYKFNVLINLIAAVPTPGFVAATAFFTLSITNLTFNVQLNSNNAFDNHVNNDSCYTSELFWLNAKVKTSLATYLKDVASVIDSKAFAALYPFFSVT